ncbi:hypothetical protein KJ780_01755, partial [Candidatus Micrarchaeota archaeon]|nr:hypothetical protein [Candidatus Micrarchaeota archaeon]
SLSVSDVWYAQIILDYEAAPYYAEDGSILNSSGLFIMERSKPRTMFYTLNDAALNFFRTPTGNIQLNPNMKLSIVLPSNALLNYVNPIPSNLKTTTFPAKVDGLSWQGLTLTQFSVRYSVEQGLDKEVLEFFSDFQNRMRIGLLSPEGLAALLIAAILAISFFYLRLSRR